MPWDIEKQISCISTKGLHYKHVLSKLMRLMNDAFESREFDLFMKMSEKQLEGWLVILNKFPEEIIKNACRNIELRLDSIKTPFSRITIKDQFWFYLKSLENKKSTPTVELDHYEKIYREFSAWNPPLSISFEEWKDKMKRHPQYDSIYSLFNNWNDYIVWFEDIVEFGKKFKIKPPKISEFEFVSHKKKEITKTLWYR